MTQMDMDQYFVQFLCFVLVLVRVSGSFLLAPVFGSANVPLQVRIWAAAFISLAMLPVINIPSNITKDISFTLYFIFIAKEFAVGFILGFLTDLILLTTRVAGECVGRMIGFGMGSVIDPSIDSQIDILNQYLYIFTALLFITLNGHLMVLKLLARSFEYIPLGNTVFSGKVSLIATRLYAFMFERGVALGAPLLGVLLVISLSTGILGKLVPELEVMVFDLPLRIAAGLVGVFFTIPALALILKKLILVTEKYSNAAISLMSGGKS